MSSSQKPLERPQPELERAAASSRRSSVNVVEPCRRGAAPFDAGPEMQGSQHLNASRITAVTLQRLCSAMWASLC